MGFLLDYVYKTKYCLVILKKHNGIYYFEKKIVKNQPKFFNKNANKTYVLNLNNVAYINKNIRVFYVDSETGNEISMNDCKNALKPEILDVMVGNNFLSKFMNSVSINKKEKIFFMIGGCIIGVLLGLIIMQSIMNNKIQQLYEELSQSQIPTIFESVKVWWMFK